MNESKKTRRRIFCTLYYIILSIAFIYGVVTVHINCYNTMHSEPMVVFEVSDDRIILLGHVIEK